MAKQQELSIQLVKQTEEANKAWQEATAEFERVSMMAGQVAKPSGCVQPDQVATVQHLHPADAEMAQAAAMAAIAMLALHAQAQFKMVVDRGFVQDEPADSETATDDASKRSQIDMATGDSAKHSETVEGEPVAWLVL